MLGNWLQERGWYYSDVFSVWTKLPRPPEGNERVIDVAAKEQTKCYGPLMAASKELGLPFERSHYLTALILLAFYALLIGGGLALLEVLT